MTLNKLTRAMKTMGCTVDKYSCTFAGETKKRTFTTYEDANGKIVAEVERIEGSEVATFNSIHPDYIDMLNEKYGIYNDMFINC